MATQRDLRARKPQSQVYQTDRKVTSRPPGAEYCYDRGAIRILLFDYNSGGAAIASSWYMIGFGGNCSWPSPMGARIRGESAFTGWQEHSVEATLSAGLMTFPQHFSCEAVRALTGRPYSP